MIPGAFARGVAQGLWTDGSPVLAPKANLLIGELNYDRLVPHKPLNILIISTGLADVPGTTNLKEAQFDWSYQNVPSVIKRFIALGGSGRAIFRLYDDGWRIEQLNVNVANQRPELTSDELRDEKSDTNAYTELQAKISEEKRRTEQKISEERRRAEQKIAEEKRIAAEKLAEQVRIARTETKVLRTWQYRNYSQIIKYTLTDVDLKKDDGHYISTIWLGRIQNIGWGPSRLSISLDFRVEPGSVLIDGSEPELESIRKDITSATMNWWKRFNHLPAAVLVAAPADFRPTAR